MIKKIVLMVLIMFLLAPPKVKADDDFQYWSLYNLKLIDTKYVDYVNHSQLRFFDDSSDLGLWLTSQQLKFSVINHVDFGLNYTYLENEVKKGASQEKEFKYQHRLELEANPYWNISDHLKVKNRNRIEFRWIEGKGSDNARYRQRWEFEVPVKNIKWLKSVYMNNEVFIDFHERKINENRAIPVGVKFQIHKKIDCSLFYMIQSKRSTKDWLSNQIFGTSLSVSL